MSNNTKLLCLFLKAQKIDKSSEQGYAMAMVSMVSIVMLSLLAASMTFSNLAKSRTDGFVDTMSSFTVAESGLNQRADELRTKLLAYSGLKGTGSPEVKELDECYGVVVPTGASKSAASTTNDFTCRNYSFESKNNISQVASGKDISLESLAASPNKYIAYTLVADKTNYPTPTSKSPLPTRIPAGEDFAGLNGLEYNFVVSSTAKRPVDVGTTTEASAKNSATTVKLSTTFTNRVVSLFQFAVFYNGDLEFNATSSMQVKGWVHSNANIYVQPAGEGGTTATPITTFLDRVSATGSIYNRVDAWTPGIGRTGITRVLLTGTTCPTAIPLPAGSNCLDVSPYQSATETPLENTELGNFAGRVTAGIKTLEPPAPGFARKRNYATNKIGEYYAKADMRLEMVPDRDVTSKPATGLWVRDKKYIPFNFTAITIGGAGTCTTTAPTAGNEENYIAPDREGDSLHCNKLTKGQLQSLRQPVLVLTKQNQTGGLAIQDQEKATLKINQPAVPTPPTAFSTFSTFNNINNDETKKNKILRALQVSLVSTPEPISLDQLSRLAFNNPSYITPTDPTYDANLNAFRAEFSRLLDVMFPVTAAGTTASDGPNRDDKRILLSATPSDIAALQATRFLPAPIQRVETTTVQDAANNLRRSGFYDGRERRWISLLQTNIASLSVWNRDGLYVDADNPILFGPGGAYFAGDINRNLAFNDATTASYSTRGLIFDRDTTPTTTAKGLQPLGLGSKDTTEGGLILHASVKDDLNGDGSTADATNDITASSTDAILKKKADNTNFLDDKGNTVIVDYLRKYPGKTPTSTQSSPFGFAFNGGDFLPNSLLLSSDQSVYIQGNFNNNNNPQNPNTATGSDGNRLSASVIADTITVLSNECINLTTVSPAGTPAGQLNCGTIGAYNPAGSAMTVNAAFLSNTDVSNGNKGTGRYDNVLANKRYSGGVNNYIRLLEDWNQGGNPYALNYMGSLISLGAPLEYSGQFIPGGVPGSYYNIPFRSFNYDDNFSDISKMPPLTPKASYLQQRNFGHTY
jgi:Tfp pilus assembly protein PilX